MTPAALSDMAVALATIFVDDPFYRAIAPGCGGSDEPGRRGGDLSAAAWYLSVLGVRAHWRGAGLAGQLLAPVLAQADVEHAECYLETFNARSLAVDERLGFVVAHSTVEPVTAATYWVLIRRR